MSDGRNKTRVTTNEAPKTWPLRCHECGDSLQVSLPADTEEGTTGTATCHRGHELLFGFDGVTVMLLDEALMERR
jgi:hypothetical protein